LFDRGLQGERAGGGREIIKTLGLGKARGGVEVSVLFLRGAYCNPGFNGNNARKIGLKIGGCLDVHSANKRPYCLAFLFFLLFAIKNH